MEYNKDIYELCTEIEENALCLFCEEINKCEADVFVIMVQKAIRLFEVLLEQRKLSENIKEKIIILNQSLNYDCSYLYGKKIAIIDDIMISGTAVSSTVNKLILLGVPEEDIEIIVLALDKKFQTMDFTNISQGTNVLRCRTVMEHASCISLSYNLAKIFAYYGVPYDSDFPVYDHISWKNPEDVILGKQLLWESINISNVSQKKGKIETYVLFPSSVLMRKLWKRIGVNLEKCAHFKIRVYLKYYCDNTCECSIVPMCLFNEISIEKIHQIYEFILLQSDTKGLNLCSPIAKMRFIQYFISHQFYVVINEAISLEGNQYPLKEKICMLFGALDGEIISSLLKTWNGGYNYILQIEGDKFIDDEITSEYLKSDDGKEIEKITKRLMTDEINTENYNINEIIFQPFLWWYQTKELPTREEVRNKKCHYVEDFNYIESKMDRLNNGFSFRMLLLFFDTLLQKSGYDSEKAVSLFFDRGIDEGMIVPTIYVNQGYIYRVYRHGEDLPFGLADQERLLFFLEKLVEQIPDIEEKEDDENNIGIATVSLEKIIVLFYQCGLKDGNIFNRFLGFDNRNVLKPYLCVHGRVQGFMNPAEVKRKGIQEHLYSSKTDDKQEYITWLTTWLVKEKYIRLLKGSRYVYVISKKIKERKKMSDIDNLIQGKIETIATMLAYWYNNRSVNKMKDLFKEDATIITSCADYYVFASAIATEIHYFNKYWEQNVQSEFKKIEKGECSIDFQYNSIMEGLQSGRDKVKWHKEGKYIDVIKMVYALMPFSYKGLWKKYWDKEISFEYKNDQEQELLDQMIGYLYLYSACYDWLCMDGLNKKGVRSQKYNEYLNEFESHYKLQDQAENLFNIFDQLDEKKEITDKINWLNLNISNFLKCSEKLVEKIEEIVANRSSTYTVRYSNALIIDAAVFEDVMLDEIFMNLWDSLPEDIDKTKMNIISFNHENQSNEYKRYGFFYGVKQEQINTNIWQIIYEKVGTELKDKVYSMRAIYIPDMPAGMLYEHNTQKNIYFASNTYNQGILSPLETYFRQGKASQFLLVTTRNTPIERSGIINQMGWVNHEDFLERTIDGIPSLFNISLYWYDYLRTDRNKIQNSIVSIIDREGSFGTGLLFRTKRRIVCLTCNHIFIGKQLENFSATLGTGMNIKFSSENSKKLSAEEHLPAEKELVIFELNFKTNDWIDPHGILSKDDLDENADMGTMCSCSGYPVGRQDWVYDLSLGMTIENGYIQVINGNKGLGGGYSGGPIVEQSGSKKVLGIHKESTENGGIAISAKSIKNKIDEYEEENSDEEH